MDQDDTKIAILVKDYTFLLKSSCHMQQRLRTIAANYLQSLTEHFPFLFLKP